ncbi:hypothetical protein [Liquorilactobacillus mali]|uniref:hypothetical protein n=1 Tax=Liquorilactobacillus mali TaxID=1618 RepID=UPI001F0420A4|nr:hypothetical protein [Liquorilactobacillus mali]
MNTMNSFGSRLTGSTGQNQFIDWLEKQARKMNLAVHENKYSFLNWTEKDSSLYVNKQKSQYHLCILIREKQVVKESAKN